MLNKGTKKCLPRGLEMHKKFAYFYDVLYTVVDT